MRLWVVGVVRVCVGCSRDGGRELKQLISKDVHPAVDKAWVGTPWQREIERIKKAAMTKLVLHRLEVVATMRRLKKFEYLYCMYLLGRIVGKPVGRPKSCDHLDKQDGTDARSL